LKKIVGNKFGYRTNPTYFSYMSLTEKQIQVLMHLANGLTAKESGQKLKISNRTVEMHYTRIKDKMGAKTLPHLVHIAHVKKLI
jgi:DNA-binding CsgD family transcriptional regulator